MATITVLRPGDPPGRFPRPDQAGADGLLAVGGDLEPERLLSAYRQGIFPWYEDGQPILWWSPDPRAVVEPGEVRLSRSLRKTLRHGGYHVSVDMGFADVIEACAQTRAAQGTWITVDMRAAYLRLHELGYAHSVETWLEGELVGGLYGIAIGRVFFGESMFSTRRDASKVAFIALRECLGHRGIELIDCQLPTAHLASLGSRMVARDEFLARLHRLTELQDSGEPWHREAFPTTLLPVAGPTA